MAKLSLLNKTEYKINDYITVRIPKVADLTDVEISAKYMALMSIFINTPCDLMVELDDMQIDYTEITEYELFVFLFSAFLTKPKPFVWDMMFSKFNYEDINNQPIINDKGQVIFVNKYGEKIIEEKDYRLISDVLCQIFFAERNMELYKVPEKATRKYIIDRQRIKNKRKALHNKNKNDNFLDSVILMLVNNANFKYNFEEVNDLSVYNLYASFKQIFKNIEVDGIMQGYYFGNIDISKISKEALNRFVL